MPDLETMRSDLAQTKIETQALRDLRTKLSDVAYLFRHETGFAAQLQGWARQIVRNITEGEQLEALIEQKIREAET